MEDDLRAAYASGAKSFFIGVGPGYATTEDMGFAEVCE